MKSALCLDPVRRLSDLVIMRDLSKNKHSKPEESSDVEMFWCSYLIWTGGLVDPAYVFIMLLRLGLVCHAVGLVHRRHVVHQGDGLHCLVNSAADGLSDLSGSWSPGGWKVMGGLWTIR